MRHLHLASAMSASQIIEEIQRLPPTEQAEVVQFAYRLDAERMLSGEEIGALAQRMIDATDPLEKLKLRDELTRGFYGGKPDAWDSAACHAAGAAPAPVGSCGPAGDFSGTASTLCDLARNRARSPARQMVQAIPRDDRLRRE